MACFSRINHLDSIQHKIDGSVDKYINIKIKSRWAVLNRLGISVHPLSTKLVLKQLLHFILNHVSAFFRSEFFIKGDILSVLILFTKHDQSPTKDRAQTISNLILSAVHKQGLVLHFPFNRLEALNLLQNILMRASQFYLRFNKFLLLNGAELHLFNDLRGPFHLLSFLLCKQVRSFAGRDHKVSVQTRKQSIDYIFEIIFDLSMSFSTTGADPVFQSVQQQIYFIYVSKFFIFPLLRQARLQLMVDLGILSAIHGPHRALEFLEHSILYFLDFRIGFLNFLFQTFDIRFEFFLVDFPSFSVLGCCFLS